MFKKALWLMIPFMLIFLLGLILLMRPQYHVPIVEVMDTFTRQEKTGQRSAHRHTVDYATVVCAATMGPACLLLFWIIVKRKNAGDRRGMGS